MARNDGDCGSGGGRGSPAGGRAGGALLHPMALAAAVALVYAALHASRAADGNTLTSWRWVFDATGRNPVLLALPALGAALLLARVPVAGPRHGPALFLAAYALGALFWREPEVIIDAARYFVQAKHLELHGAGSFLREWGHGIPAWTDLPAVPFLYGIIFRAVGESRVAVQAVTTALFAGTAVLTYRIGATLWGEAAGRWAGWLLLGFPYLFTQVPLLLVDVPAMFALTLSFLCFLLALERGGVWMGLIAPASISLALFTKFSLWPLLSTLALWGAGHALAAPAGAVRRARLGRAAAVGLAALALAAPLWAYQRSVLLGQLALLFGYQWEGLRRWSEGLASVFVFQTSPLVTAFALSAVPLAAARRDWRFAVLSWPIVLMLVLEAQRMRYLLPVLPFLACLAAYGLHAVEGTALRRQLGLSAILPSLAIAVFAYLPFLEGTTAANLQRAGRHLDRIAAARAEVVAVPAGDTDVNPAVAVPILDLFTRADLRYRPLPATPPAPEEVARSPLRFTWEFPTPDYYTVIEDAAADALVVVTGAPDAALPPAVAGRAARHRTRTDFVTSVDPFRFKTFVAVYR